MCHVGGRLCAPLVVTGVPRCFEAGYGDGPENGVIAVKIFCCNSSLVGLTNGPEFRLACPLVRVSVDFFKGVLLLPHNRLSS